MRSRRWLRLALLGARWLDRTGLRRSVVGSWMARWGRDLVFQRGALLPGRYVTTELDGFRLGLPQNLTGSYVIQPFEPMARSFMADSLRPGGIAVDVGANIGFHTLHFARAVGPTGRVHAVEPAEDNLAFLRWNVTANGLDNVEIHPCAAGSSERPRALYLQAKGTLHGFYPRQEHPAPTVEVEERPLDRLVAPPVDFVKIDTEGAEVEVLRGMEQTVRGSPSVRLLVEWNLAVLAEQDRPFEELPDLLASWGFDLAVADEERGLHLRVPEVLESLRAGRFGRLRALNLEAWRSSPGGDPP